MSTYHGENIFAGSAVADEQGQLSLAVVKTFRYRQTSPVLSLLNCAVKNLDLALDREPELAPMFLALSAVSLSAHRDREVWFALVPAWEERGRHVAPPDQVRD